MKFQHKFGLGITKMYGGVYMRRYMEAATSTPIVWTTTTDSSINAPEILRDYTQQRPDYGKCEYCATVFMYDEEFDGRCDACGAPLNMPGEQEEFSIGAKWKALSAQMQAQEELYKHLNSRPSS